MEINAEAPGPVSPVVLAGARALVETALMDLIGDISWVSSITSDRRFELGVPELSVEEYGGAVRRAVDEVFASMVELSGWRWEIVDDSPRGATDEISPDDPDLTVDGLVDDMAELLVTDLAESLRTEARVFELASQFHAIDLDELFSDFGNADTSDLLAGHAKKRLEGLLVMAALIVSDELHQDAARLREDPSAHDDTMILWMLPDRFKHRYTPVFVQQFATVFADLTRRIQLGWEYPSCVAQELCVRIWFDQAEIDAEILGIDLPDGWRGQLEDALLEDTDHEYLYDLSADGFEEDPTFGPGGMAPMGFDDWFRPFRSDDFVPLYALPLDEPDLPDLA